MPGKEWNIPKEKWNKKQVLLVFARAPEKGRVKTRLAEDLGAETTLELYRRFVSRALSAARMWAEGGACGGGRREIWVCFTPAEKKEMMENWLGREHTFLAQTGSGLGERMSRALAEAFRRGADRAVLVGSDIPDMGADHLAAAFEALDRTDLVWGPSLDGGYWLVGASKPGSLDRLFSDIPWGTNRVFPTSLERCREENLSWTVLTPLQDVDTVSDLKSTEFYREIRDSP